MLARASISLSNQIPEVLYSPPNIMIFIKKDIFQRRTVIPSSAGARNPIQSLESLTIVPQISTEKRPMHAFPVIQLFPSSRHHIVVWRFSHHFQHLVGRVQYHFSVAPRYGGDQNDTISISLKSLYLCGNCTGSSLINASVLFFATNLSRYSFILSILSFLS